MREREGGGGEKEVHNPPITIQLRWITLWPLSNKE